MKKKSVKKSPLKLKLSIPLPNRVEFDQGNPGCSTNDEMYGDSVPKSIYELNKLLEKQREKQGALQTFVNDLESTTEFLTAGRKLLFEIEHKDRKQVSDLCEQVKVLKDSVLKTMGEYSVDICMICQKQENEPRVVGLCGHAFACIKCLPLYFEQVMKKHGGNWICLKCKNAVTFSVLQA